MDWALLFWLLFNLFSYLFITYKRECANFVVRSARLLSMLYFRFLVIHCFFTLCLGAITAPYLEHRGLTVRKMLLLMFGMTIDLCASFTPTSHE